MICANSRMAQANDSVRANRRRFFILKGKRRKTMLNTLLSVIRAILVELVDQLLRKVCTLG